MNSIKKYNDLFTADDYLDDVIERYVNGKITKKHVLFYMDINDFSRDDVDWELIERTKHKRKMKTLTTI